MIKVSGRALANRSFIAILDQALVSASNLTVGLAFIRYGSKSDYGIYGLLFAGIMLAQNIQNAIVLSPMTTVIPGLSESNKWTALRWIKRVQWLLLAGLVVVSSLVFWFYGRDAADPVLLTFAFGASVGGVLVREAQRAFQYLNLDAGLALLGSCLFSGILIVGIVVFVSLDTFNLVNVLLLTAVAGFSNVLLALFRTRSTQPVEFSSDSTAYKTSIFECIRWALPSVLASWFASNAYVYPVGAVMGLAAVADIAAARLLLMPIGLVITGWSNVLRPRASAMWASFKMTELRRLIGLSLAMLVAISISYSILIVMLYPFISPMLGSQYVSIAGLVAAWGVFFVTLTVRSVGGIAMLSSPDGFKPLFIFGVYSIGATLVFVPVACYANSAQGVVLALAGAEFLLAAMIWNFGWRRMLMRRQVL